MQVVSSGQAMQQTWIQKNVEIKANFIFPGKVEGKIGNGENFKGLRLMPPTLEAVGDSSKRTLREIESLFFYLAKI